MARIRALEPEPAPAEGPEGRKEETEPTEMPKVVPLRRPMPRWARTAAALAACCVLGFGVYQAGLIDQMSPAAQSGESIGASSGVTAYAAPAPGEDEETSGAAAALPAPEEGQQPSMTAGPSKVPAPGRRKKIMPPPRSAPPRPPSTVRRLPATSR